MSVFLWGLAAGAVLGVVVYLAGRAAWARMIREVLSEDGF